MGQTADKVIGTDHHTVCKFETALDGYRIVEDRLNKIHKELLEQREIGRTGQAAALNQNVQI